MIPGSLPPESISARMDRWLLQVGFSYDTSPVDSDDRTPDMPMDRQIRYTTGVQYKWSDRALYRGAVRICRLRQGQNR